MTEEQIECLATRIIQRLQPPLLVMVTAAEGYRQEIFQRLAGCALPLHFALDDAIPDAARWQAIGHVLPAEHWQQRLPDAPYRALMLPFADYPLAAQLVNGNLQSPVAKRLYDALLAGIPVLALRYHCDPDSELNQLRGVMPDSPWARKMRETLSRLAECGVQLCTINQLLAKADLRTQATPVLSPSRRYLTVSDVVSNPAQVSASDNRLTDAASDYLKNQKNIYPK
ncbi:hypothetical protein [Erwinia mallotivora]|uniref:hypothetical protein n=1 Tax=Erwinia mallotivora TaxID=69222 RepID=UPI0021BF0B8D|nr:hypothetical protein [Erwinia mallotivora]